MTLSNKSTPSKMITSDSAGRRNRHQVILRDLRIIKPQPEPCGDGAQQTSSNSSRPPSSDPPSSPPRPPRPRGQRKRGAQPGHTPHQRELYPLEACDEVEDYYPTHCEGCGGELEGSDPQPLRHQVVEIPETNPNVIEHRLHQLTCKECGALTRASLPAGCSWVRAAPGSNSGSLERVLSLE